MKNHWIKTGISAAAVTLALAAGTALVPGRAAASDKPYERIHAPKLRDIVVPPVRRVTLDNGLQVFILEDHDLPLFRMSLTMKAGSAFNPSDKLGLAEVTAEVLRSGGSEALPGDRMDEVLESMGGSIEVSAGALETSLDVDVLVEDTEKALHMVQDLLQHPAYPQDKIDLSLTQLRSGIARRNDDPESIAAREANKILYGPDHPFAAQIEYKDVANIKREDLVAFHQKYIHPGDAYLAVWGDFKTDEILDRLRNLLGVWPKVDVQYPPIPEVPATTASVNLIDKESVNQSNIVIGHRGTTAKDPDYFALSVMNEILGGSFGSRLFNEVRSRQGLSYHVSSDLGAGLEYPGMFEVDCGTKSETTVKAIRSCIEEVRKMQTQPVTSEELQRAKDGILNSFVFNFTHKGAIVNRQVMYARHGYPTDFLEQYARGIEKVSIVDVQRAAAKYLHPEQLAITVVGKPADFGEKLDALGTVHAVDITIPEPPVVDVAPAPTPETLARGKQILADAAKASGGVEALQKVTNLTEESNVTLSMMGQSLPAKATRYVQYPGNVRFELNVMGQKMVQVFNDKANLGFEQAPQGGKDFDSAELEEARADFARDRILYLRDFASYKPQWLAEADVNGAKTDVVLMSPPGRKTFKICVDQKTHMVVKEEYPGKSFQGAPVYEEHFLEDYKKIGAVLMPHKITVNQDGKAFLSSSVTGFTLGEIPAEKFKKTQS
jgi:zinc protease